MPNLLRAIINIKNNYKASVENVTTGSNKMNIMGDGLETYMKNAFAEVLGETDKSKIENAYSKTFSYRGNKRNPPDFILKGSDAIEVKKQASPKSKLNLNSSSLKQKLTIENPKITKECQSCEGKNGWKEKDLIYAIGHIPKDSDTLKAIWLIMGDCYAANDSIYQALHDAIAKQIKSLTNYEHNVTTKELGGIRNADPLATSYLRCRPMWNAEHPANVFKDHYQLKSDANFQLVSILLKSKFDSFPNEDKQNILNDENITVKDISINDPSSLNKKLSAKIITFCN